MRNTHGAALALFMALAPALSPGLGAQESPGEKLPVVAHQTG
jgi:hypothetical protein